MIEGKRSRPEESALAGLREALNNPLTDSSSEWKRWTVNSIHTNLTANFLVEECEIVERRMISLTGWEDFGNRFNADS